MIYDVEFVKGADGLPGLMTIVDVLTVAPSPAEGVEFAAALMQVDTTGITLRQVSEQRPVNESGQPFDLPGIYEVTVTVDDETSNERVVSRTAWDGYTVARGVAQLRHPGGEVEGVVWRPDGDAYGVAVTGDVERIVIVHAPTSVEAARIVSDVFPDRGVIEVAGIIDGLGMVTVGPAQTQQPIAIPA